MEQKNNPIGLDEILDLLKKNNIKAKLVDFDNYGFSRTIAFSVYEIDYRIVWFKNQSNLMIGNHKRSPIIPFRYMCLDNTFPLVEKNRSIAFYYKKENKGFLKNEHPFESFRIPIEI